MFSLNNKTYQFEKFSNSIKFGFRQSKSEIEHRKSEIHMTFPPLKLSTFALCY